MIYDYDSYIKELLTSVPQIDSASPVIRILSGNLSIDNADGLPIKVYTISGIKVWETVNYNQEQIPVDKGVYIVQVNGETKKIVNL